MRVLRTPEDRFNNLPGYPFVPNYHTIDDLEGGALRVHYLDEGPTAGPLVLLMHGEPTWSYLYRHIVPVLTQAGCRCIVPDLVGFGRSDKPMAASDYTYARQVSWMQQLLFSILDVSEVTLFAQDWGGLIGLRLLAASPSRFSRVVVANTGLPTGEGRPTDAFLQWQRYAAESPRFDIGKIVKGGCRSDLSVEEVAAYDAPFPDDSYKVGARRLPGLVPTSPDDPAHADNVAAWEVLRTFKRPFLCSFSDSDPITAGGDRVFRREIPGAKELEHATVEGAGHFLQEDHGPKVAEIILSLMGCVPEPQ